MENSRFTDLISLKEAADIWKIDDSVLRHAISSGRLVENVDVKKFGKQWVITRQAMQRLYGYKPKNIDLVYDRRKMQAALIYVSKVASDYSKQENISISDAYSVFSKHNIGQFITDCFEYYEHCTYKEVLDEITKKVKEGFVYDWFSKENNSLSW